MANYDKQEFVLVKGFLVSNTCDAAAENKRLFKSHISFAPIFDLAKYEEYLRKEHGNIEKVTNHVESIRKQQQTAFLYLPAGGNLDKECFVRFDCIFSLPASKVNTNELCKKRLFTLSDFGAYLLVFKLSVHFSRVQDKVSRGTT